MNLATLMIGIVLYLKYPLAFRDIVGLRLASGDAESGAHIGSTFKPSS